MTGKVGKFLRKAFSTDRLMALALLAGFVFLYISDPYPVNYLRLKTFDFYQKLKPREIPPPAQKPVTIIDLDEDSLTEIGQWPWPRNIVAQLVKNLMQMGAAIVAFDVVFAEPDRMNPSDVANAIYGLDDQTKEKLRLLKGNDQAFADVIKESRVVLGQAGYWEEKKVKVGPPVKKSIAIKGKSPNEHLPKFKSLVRNMPVIEEAAAKARLGGHGIFSLVPEPDGIVRRVPTLFNHEELLYPSLAVEMMRLAFQSQTIVVETDVAGVKEVKIASKKAFPPDGLSLPTDNKGRVWPYFSKSDKAKYVSAREILAGTADPALIKGKMTIIGTSAVGLLDIRATPVDSVIPGVEVHVQLIEAALTGQYLARPNFTNGAELLLVVFGGLLMVWLVPRLGAKWTLLLLLVLAGSAAGASWYLFSEKRILFDAGFAIISILGLYILMTYTSYAKEEAQRRQTRDAFSKYLSPAMVERVADDPSRLKLGGDKRDMTLLFCDVRGFTTISEQFDAVGLTSLINKLLTPLTNVILDNQGTIDKYMGDCIMAFWNAPLDDADHARNGCRSALGMLAAMRPLNERLEAEAKVEGRKHIPLKVGAGLNSGECVVGNMGSDQRFDYSVLGDTVNLASRLEGQSKAYGVDIIIGSNTRERAPDMASIELDFIQVKGKTTGIKIFALLGDETVAGQKEFQALRFATDKMLVSYRAQDWAKARECLELSRGLVGNFKISGLYDLYEERIAEYEKNPPPADWNGIFIATSK